MLALALLLLLRVIRSFFALSESPVTNSLDEILPTARSFVNCNWKLEKTLFMALFFLPKTRVLRCAIQGKQENGGANAPLQSNSRKTSLVALARPKKALSKASFLRSLGK